MSTNVPKSALPWWPVYPVVPHPFVVAGPLGAPKVHFAQPIGGIGMADSFVVPIFVELMREDVLSDEGRAREAWRLAHLLCETRPDMPKPADPELNGGGPRLLEAP
jgi:hypothetical protein